MLELSDSRYQVTSSSTLRRQNAMETHVGYSPLEGIGIQSYLTELILLLILY